MVRLIVSWPDLHADHRRGGPGETKTGIKLLRPVKTLIFVIGWCLLFVLCWPLALLVLVLLPLLWLLSLPLRLLGVTLEALFAFMRGVLLLPARILGYRRHRHV